MAHIPWTIPPCRFLVSLTVCSPRSPVIPEASLSPHMTSEERANSPRGIWFISSQTGVQTTLPGSRLELPTTLWGQQHPAFLSGSQAPALAPWLWPLAGLSRFHREASLVAQWVKNAMQETQARPLGQESPLEKGVATHSSILAWRSPWTEEPGGLQSMGSHRVRHDWSDWAQEAWRLPCGPAKAASGPLLQRARPPMKTSLWRLLYFRRHPVMRKWPRPYEWFFMKMKIEYIWLQKWYGGVADISREEYFKAVPRKAWWRERKVLSFYAGNLLRSAAGQRLTAVSLWKGSQQACHPDSEQDESRLPGTPVLAGEWSGRLQTPRSHRDSS